MTDARVATADNDPLAPILLTLELRQAHELNSVLPWLLQALEDRPNLSPKQRRRRETTRTALNVLVAQLGERLPALAPVE